MSGSVHNQVITIFNCKTLMMAAKRGSLYKQGFWLTLFGGFMISEDINQ